MTPEQIPPPPRIKAWPWNGKRISGQWHVAGLGETTDYVRGDLFAAQAAELERLRAALTEIAACLDGSPDYHTQGMGCGLEDRCITDRYDAMQYGWDEAIDRVYSEHVSGALEVARAALKGGTQ